MTIYFIIHMYELGGGGGRSGIALSMVPIIARRQSEIQNLITHALVVNLPLFMHKCIW